MKAFQSDVQDSKYINDEQFHCNLPILNADREILRYISVNLSVLAYSHVGKYAIKKVVKGQYFALSLTCLEFLSRGMLTV